MLNLFKTFLLINKSSMNEPELGYAGKVFTKAEIKSEVEIVMKSLALLKLRAGQLLMLFTPLVPEGVFVTLAANALGIKVAYANFEGTEGEFLEELLRYKAKAILRYDSNGALWFHTAERSVKYTQIFDEAKNSEVDLSLRTKLHSISFRALIYLQTSGSTAIRPKGLPFTNLNAISAMLYAAKSTGTTTHSDDVEKALCVLNFRHPYGWMPLFVNLMGGNRIELAVGATSADIAEWYKLSPSYIYGTPQFLRTFMNETPKDADLSFLRKFFCAGDSTSETLFEDFAEFCKQHNALRAELCNNYGIGELLCVGTTSDGIPHKPGASGKFYKGLGLKWKIVDENFHPVSPGTVGELLVRSLTTIRRYYKNPEATKKAFVRIRGKKYFRPGDYGSCDENGYVTIVGREKDFCIPYNASDKVNAETIRRPLLELKELVVDAYVLTYKLSDEYGCTCAFVALKDGLEKTDATRVNILAELEKVLQPFQLPHDIVFLDEIPIDPSSKKVDRKRLFELIPRA